MEVTPRPASTVVLLDHLDRVYLTQRPKTMKFMGGIYVFPGGAVDDSDAIYDDEYIKNEKRDESISQSYYIAAARELFEEAGILLCQTVDGTPVLLEEDTALEYRRLLIKGEISFLHMLKKEALYLNLEYLTYFGRIVTPSQSKIRFDTKFFLARLPEGQTPIPDENEIDDSLWIHPQEALTRYEEETIPLAPPTIHTLKTIVHYVKSGQLSMPEFNRSDYKIVF
ncbi:NUDIX hydrolase [Neobacillus citreus]|uniref:NUDIX hydrolase n=1 Tax=Neobacillus citreus TaxID=2833578 RepID=A0A942SU77_9BACI|nr:NUDIX hydrolase [Neobacillus citreus]MCH6264759.1 NUDIX hydrolase [Neobacillus citreus]